MEQDDLSLQQGASLDTPKEYNVKVWTDVNGDPIMKTVSEDELLSGYMMQSDYSRKTQELAKEREMLKQSQTQQPNIADEDEQVRQALDKWGYAKVETVESLVEKKLQSITKSQKDEQAIQSVIASNPDLKQFEWAIRKIAATDDSAIEDIVVKYGFSNHDKLSKAKQRWIVWGGDKFASDEPKKPENWTKEDRAKFEAQASKWQFR
jgi:vacuolar-type H+-ATPase subunit I/STV1